MSARRQGMWIVARPRSIWDIRHLASDDLRVSVYSELLETRGVEAVLSDGLEDQMMSQRLPLPLEQAVYAQEMTQNLVLPLV
jgi:hypothetical protein